jgi:hypothetical protein
VLGVTGGDGGDGADAGDVSKPDADFILALTLRKLIGIFSRALLTSLLDPSIGANMEKTSSADIVSVAAACIHTIRAIDTSYALFQSMHLHAHYSTSSTYIRITSDATSMTIESVLHGTGTARLPESYCRR